MQPEKLGPFRILRVVGRGGMGAVYEARHEETGKSAAVKVLLSTLDEDDEIRQRFGAEIQALKKLHHPNIAQLYGFGEENGQLFYAMEYVDGPSLHQELKRRHQFQWNEVAKIGLGLCAALKHAHDRGVVHRDIKPANILLDQEGTVKLSDFGIAYYFGANRMTTVNSVVGTLEYMSPEQALANPATPRSDLYSLGAVLYALLLGRPPFLAKTLPEILRKHQRGIIESIRSSHLEVPDELEAVVLDLLRTKSEERPINAYVVARRFQAIVSALGDDTDSISVRPTDEFDYVASSPPKNVSSNSPDVLTQMSSHTEKRIVPESDVIDLDGIVTPSHPRLSAADKRDVFLEPAINEQSPFAALPPDTQNKSTVSESPMPDSLKIAGELTCFEKYFPPSDGTKNIDALSSNIGGPKLEEKFPEQSNLPSNEWPEEKKTDSPTMLRRDTVGSDSSQYADLPSKASHFVEVDASELGDYREVSSRPIISLQLIVTALTLLLVGLMTWYLLQPKSSEQLLQQIRQTLQKSDSSDDISPGALRQAKSDIQVFLATFPNHESAEEVRDYSNRIWLLDEERNLARRSYRKLSLAEQIYFDAIALERTQPEQAIKKLHALIQLFGNFSDTDLGDPAASQHTNSRNKRTQKRMPNQIVCVTLAKNRLEQLEKEFNEICIRQSDQLESRLETAKSLEESEEPEDRAHAKIIWQAIINLYEDHPWAEEYVNRAKAKLAEEIP